MYPVFRSGRDASRDSILQGEEKQFKERLVHRVFEICIENDGFEEKTALIYEGKHFKCVQYTTSHEILQTKRLRCEKQNIQHSIKMQIK